MGKIDDMHALELIGSVDELGADFSGDAGFSLGKGARPAECADAGSLEDCWPELVGVDTAAECLFLSSLLL